MNGYEKIPDEDQALAPKIRGVEPPAYAHVNVDEESRGSDVDEEQRYAFCQRMPLAIESGLLSLRT